jgi:succinate dehydrogenase / fumarate reductase, cytochrome b subunit
VGLRNTRVPTLKNKRPVNLDISTIHLPLAAWTSIAHRVSGIIVFVGTAILLWLLDGSLASETSFNEIKAAGMSPVAKFLVWGVTAALAYHMVAGVKHLFMDAGIGESKEGGPKGAKITIIVSAILIVLLGVWIW